MRDALLSWLPLIALALLALIPAVPTVPRTTRWFGVAALLCAVVVAVLVVTA